MAAPDLQIDDLLRQVVAFHRSGVRNDLKLRAFYNEAQSLLPSNPGEAHMVMGVVAGLKGCEEDALRHHQASLSCGRSRERIMNYVVTLNYFHRYDEALACAQEVVNRDPADLEALRAVIGAAFTTGQFQLTAHWLAEYAKRIPVLEQWDQGLAKMRALLPLIASTAEQLDLADGVLAAFHRPLWQILRTFGEKQDVTITDKIHREGGDCFISRTLELPMPFAEIQAIDDQLVRHWAEQDEVWPVEKFIILLREREAA